jgi:D-sedoheptulose 7-phosphate isomerase
VSAVPSPDPQTRPLLDAAARDWHQLADSLNRLSEPLDALCRMLATCWNGGGKLLVCGNGGSAADAMHVAEELVARFQADRPGLAAVSLTDATVLTCAGNDFGYDKIFSRQVEALGRPGDVLLLLSTSGNSPNILAAHAAAVERNVRTAALLGKGGGRLKGQCDVELIVEADTSHRVQEVHKLLYHTMCEWADQYALARTGGER